MNKKISHAQFVEYVYRSFHGQSNIEIAHHFDVKPHALSNLKKRRKDEWDAITAQLTTAHIEKLQTHEMTPSRLSDAQRRANAILLAALGNVTVKDGFIQRLISRIPCAPEDAEKYFDAFQEHYQMTLFCE